MIIIKRLLFAHIRDIKKKWKRVFQAIMNFMDNNNIEMASPFGVSIALHGCTRLLSDI